MGTLYGHPGPGSTAHLDARGATPGSTTPYTRQHLEVAARPHSLAAPDSTPAAPRQHPAPHRQHALVPSWLHNRLELLSRNELRFDID